jgi:hypothetical protein
VLHHPGVPHHACAVGTGARSDELEEYLTRLYAGHGLSRSTPANSADGGHARKRPNLGKSLFSRRASQARSALGQTIYGPGIRLGI